jgi:2-haloacid dehalogenase
MDYRAIAFDTGGTVLDWHASMLDEVKQIEAWQPLVFDRHEFVNTWRRNTMKGIVGQLRPTFHMDDVHWTALEQAIASFNLPVLAPDVMKQLWRGWHRLRAWPDFPAALARLRQHLPVVSFTMLPTSLVVDVSRLNGITWDAIISCQMIGVYKPHAEAYATAAEWLGIKPHNILMVACHNFDLNAAQDAGLKTAFVHRPHEWGPAGPPDPLPNRAYDLVCDGFDDLAAQVLGQ